MGNVLEVLKKGMSTELWGMRFYEQAVAHTTSEQGKNVFKSLVDEETRHLDILCGQYSSVSGSEKCVSVEDAAQLGATIDPTTIFPAAESAEDLIPADTTDEQALKMAMDFEKKGYDIYAVAAKEAASDDEKTMWEWLAKAEDKHYAFLQETLEYLVNDGVWYYDDLEKPMFEG